MNMVDRLEMLLIKCKEETSKRPILIIMSQEEFNVFSDECCERFNLRQVLSTQPKNELSYFSRGNCYFKDIPVVVTRIKPDRYNLPLEIIMY